MPKQKPELPVKEFEIVSLLKTCTVYDESEEAAKKLFLQMFPGHRILKVTEKPIKFKAIIF